MKTVDPLLKNEYSKRVYTRLGLRKPLVVQGVPVTQGKAPGLVRYVKGLGTRFGRIQLIRQEPASLRQARWGLHLDDNNRLNPMVNGWVVRLWLQLTDDPESALVLRPHQFDRANEVQVPLRKGTQVILDSEAIFHSGYHKGPDTRYALIVSLESTEHLDDWVRGQLP